MFDPDSPTVGGGYVNVLAWPTMEGWQAYFKLTPVVQGGWPAPNGSMLGAMVEKIKEQTFDFVDEHREDNDETLTAWRECHRLANKPWRIIPFPGPPPFLREDIVRDIMEQAGLNG